MAQIDRKAFFRLLFGPNEGIICIATMPSGQKKLSERYFVYPQQLDDIEEYVQDVTEGNNVYFCPQLLGQKKRNKNTVIACPNIWSDLDSCKPEVLLVAPTVVVESSNGRYHAYWVLEKPLIPRDAEDIARKIAYRHADDGADRGGWDLSQLLRVPGTFNFKYDTIVPEVKVVTATRGRYRVEDFVDYPQAKGYEALDLPVPSDLTATGSVEEILTKYAGVIPGAATHLMTFRPEGDWSRPLWQLLMILGEVGMTAEEMYVLASGAACNKWARDGNPQRLWKDVLRSYVRAKENLDLHKPQARRLSSLLSAQEQARVDADETFLERYIRWASTLGDAAVQYHQAGAFVLLSSLIAGPVKLRTSFGLITPNLWFMILADTTLTRKTTAMDIAVDLLEQIDTEAILATDGSVEGLLTGLQSRPGRPSLFLRDEVSGLLEQMTKKDYMAGMAEALTKLYDGKLQKRMLKKEVITVRNPVLIFFAGGIKTRVCAILNEDWIQSGFIPRFIIITAESDMSRRRPIGPATSGTKEGEDEILRELQMIHVSYHQQVEFTIDTSTQTVVTEREYPVELTPRAWVRWNQLDEQMATDALASESPDLAVPMTARLAISTLKAAVLIAASRLRTPGQVTVDDIDIIHAISYTQNWQGYAYEVIRDTGKTSDERRIQQVFKTISKHPGIARADIMRRYHLQARVMDGIMDTLEQRAMVTRTKKGRGEIYHPTSQLEIPIQQEETVS